MLARSAKQLVRKYWKQFVVVMLMAVLVAPPSFLVGRVSAQSERERDVLTAFETMRKKLKGSAKKLGDSKRAAILSKELDSAEEDLRAAAFCEAIARLAAALAEAQEFQKSKYNQAAEDLFNGFSQLRRDVITISNGKCREAEIFERPTVIKLESSDAKLLQGRVQFAEARFSSTTADGELYTEIEVPGLAANVGIPGLPGVPVLHRLIAVPRGAEAVVNIKFDESRAERYRLNLHPIQPEPADSAQGGDDKGGDKGEMRFPAERFVDPPFTKDKEIYSTDDPFPAQIATVRSAGRARDLNLVQLSIAAGQYNPVSKWLTLFKEIEFEVRFIGGNGFFLDQSAASPFETLLRNYSNLLLNYEGIWTKLDPNFPKRLLCGEEYLILTHPDFREAADKLSEWKNRKGIITSVVTVNDDSGPGPDTRAEIDAFIENRFDRCGLRPSYILLLGDAEFIPTFYRSTFGSTTTGTDYPYALIGEDQDDLAPDFALGRIPVDTLDEAHTVVNKIIRYESSPPVSSSFYRNASIASQFQCCRIGGDEGRDQRSFIETSELVRNEMLSRGYSVERIYTQTVDSGYTGDSTPRRFFNGSLLPEDLRTANGFAWDGDTDDIRNAFNNGRFLIMHRDHGWKHGWAHPSFSTAQAGNLENGSLLPVIFSVNCASGLFDNETANGDYDTSADIVYFAERLLRNPNGGAVGVIGDTRDSPTWANSALTRGLFDAVWPNTVADFGGNRSHRRLGDILNHAKLYLMTQIGVAGTTVSPSEGQVRSEMYLWHVLGDPTLEMWTSKPKLDLRKVPLEGILDLRGIKIGFRLDESLLTAFQRVKDTVIALGRAEVKDGKAEIIWQRKPVNGVPIEIAASHPDAVSALLTEDPSK